MLAHSVDRILSGLSLGVLHKSIYKSGMLWKSVYVEADREGGSQAARQKRFQSLDLF